MSQEADLQYCKTDLIGAKGIVFCKYARASSALHVMETISEAGTVSVSRHVSRFAALPLIMVCVLACKQACMHALVWPLKDGRLLNYAQQLHDAQMQELCQRIIIKLCISPACCNQSALDFSHMHTAFMHFLVRCCSARLVVGGMQLAGYKIKCMLAEPKSKRHSPEAASWPSEVQACAVPPCCLSYREMLAMMVLA